MEGTLWKWTNYFSGWQPRWFVLDNGILSYYKSQDDVNSGCKGSVKMAVCDVNVHATDYTRLDLIIPGEAHFYVKAATPQERQQWLVALGSCKACLTTVGRQTSELDEVISPDILKVKKSELRLYCDLLMQQVHGVKTAVSNGVVPDVEKLNEATSLLSATCDTFIRTLEDCMTVAQAKATYEVPHQHVTDSALPSTPIQPNTKASMQRSNSADSKYSSSSTNRPGRSQEGTGNSKHLPRSKSESSAPSFANGQNSLDYMYENYNLDSRETFSKDSSAAGEDNNNLDGAEQSTEVQDSSVENGRKDAAQSHHPAAQSHHPAAATKCYKTFFTTMPATFSQVELEADGGIPVKSYLDACRAILPIFDKLSSTAFSPVKMDIDGNIKKINQKYITNPEKFSTIQSITLHEQKAQQNHLSSSATTAILWLKRAMEFIREFLAEILSGKPDLSECANTAYSKTLRPYHGWVVRGVFGVAVRSLPYRKDFLSHLAMSEHDFEQADFMNCLLKNMEDYVAAQDAVLNVMSDFLHKHDLENNEQV